MELSFSTTATIRPEIIEHTYDSFRCHLKNINLKKCSLYINIDPVPIDDSRNKNMVIEIARLFFGNVVVNTPTVASFPSAVKWCWSQASSPLLFHLEDDWILNEAIDVSQMISYFSDPNIMQVVIRAYAKGYKKFPLSPSIMRKSFYKNIARHLSTRKNPEVQMRGRIGGMDLSSTIKRQIVIPEYVVLSDIGREWLHETGFRRPKVKENFVRWTTDPTNGGAS